MSTKIYNGYKFDKDYSIRELDKLLTELRKEIQLLAIKSYMARIINEWLYIYDCKTYFGEDTAKLRMNKYEKGQKSLNPIHILLDIVSHIDEKIRQAKASIHRDPIYDYDCQIHIMPIDGKLLFTYYGEQKEYEEVIRSQSYIEEYHYQNQCDKPDYISDKDWEQRRKDWDEAIIDGIPANHGFSVDFVNSVLFPFINSEELRKYMPKFNDINERAKALAYDIEYPCTEFKMSTLLSDEYKAFIKKHTEEIAKKLTSINNIEELINIIFRH